MRRELFACILRPQSQGESILKHIEPNDLRQWSETTLPLPTSVHMRELQAYFVDHERDSIHVLVDGSRQMTDALDLFVGHCPHLTLLRIAILGPCVEPELESREQRLYQSCACFIASVRKTLHDLDFEQGYSHDEETSWENPYDQGEPIFPRPMDRIFVQQILPLITDGPWPFLEHIKIRSVRDTNREMSRDLLPTEFELKSDDVAYTDVAPC
jgi:hypothetical protein